VSFVFCSIFLLLRRGKKWRLREVFVLPRYWLGFLLFKFHSGEEPNTQVAKNASSHIT